MANLVKIKKITVYTAMTADAAECWDVLKLLKDNNVPFHHLNWGDDSTLAGLFSALNTWNYFNGTEFYHKEFTKLPIVHWECVYDDDAVVTNAAEGLAELQASELMANLSKIVQPVT
jgi:hypothetical protein